VARPGISYDDVKKAAVAIHEQGAPPSIQRVRAWLGTGSHSTIAEHLKRWQQEFSETPQLALPPSVPTAVLEALEAFWQVALSQAQTHFQQQREQAEAAVAHAQQARDTALIEKRKVEQENLDLGKELNQLHSTCRELQDALLIEQERRGAAEKAITAAQEQVRTASRAADAVRRESAEQVLQLETYLTQAKSDHAQALAQAEQRLVAERERGEASENRLMKLLDQHRNEGVQAQRRFNQQQTSWQAKETHLNDAINAGHREIVQMQIALAGVQERSTGLENQLNEQYKIQRLLEERCAASTQEIARLRIALTQSSDEKQQLNDALTACQKALENALEVETHHKDDDI
jgi:hypothetical protein